MDQDVRSTPQLNFMVKSRNLFPIYILKLTLASGRGNISVLNITFDLDKINGRIKRDCYFKTNRNNLTSHDCSPFYQLQKIAYHTGAKLLKTNKKESHCNLSF